MNDSEVVEVCRAGHDLRELKVIKDKAGTYENSKCAHQSQTVRLWIGPGVFHHVPVLHPVGDNTEALGICGDGNSQQRQDVGVRQALPTYNLPAKPLCTK